MVTADTFAEAMANMANIANMDKCRKETAKLVDKLIILSTEAVSNVKLELEYFTESKVMIF